MTPAGGWHPTPAAWRLITSSLCRSGLVATCLQETKHFKSQAPGLILEKGRLLHSQVRPQACWGAFTHHDRARFQAVCPQALGIGFPIVSFCTEGLVGAGCKGCHRADRHWAFKVEAPWVPGKYVGWPQALVGLNKCSWWRPNTAKGLSGPQQVPFHDDTSHLKKAGLIVNEFTRSEGV